MESNRQVAIDLNHINEPRKRPSGSRAPPPYYTTNYYYVRDHLGSIRDMVDNGGATQAHYNYDPWGRRTRTAGSRDADFGFTGHYYHARGGLHLAFYRAYSAEMGRWISRDPLDFTELLLEGPSLYNYVDNDPANSADPLGLAALVDDAAVICSAAGLAIGAYLVTKPQTDQLCAAIASYMSKPDPDKYPLKNREKRNKESRDKPKDPKEKERRQRENEGIKDGVGAGGADDATLINF